jgi:hypothetical protein
MENKIDQEKILLRVKDTIKKAIKAGFLKKHNPSITEFIDAFDKLNDQSKKNVMGAFGGFALGMMRQDWVRFEQEVLSLDYWPFGQNKILPILIKEHQEIGKVTEKSPECFSEIIDYYGIEVKEIGYPAALKSLYFIKSFLGLALYVAETKKKIIPLTLIKDHLFLLFHLKTTWYNQSKLDSFIYIAKLELIKVDHFIQNLESIKIGAGDFPNYVELNNFEEKEELIEPIIQKSEPPMDIINGEICLFKLASMESNMNCYAKFEKNQLILDYWNMTGNYEDEILFYIEEKQWPKLQSILNIGQSPEVMLYALKRTFNASDILSKIESFLTENEIQHQRQRVK